MVHAADGALGRWSQVLDLWCAGWFWERTSPPDRDVFGALVDLELHREAIAPGTQSPAPLLARPHSPQRRDIAFCTGLSRFQRSSAMTR